MEVFLECFRQVDTSFFQTFSADVLLCSPVLIPMNGRPRRVIPVGGVVLVWLEKYMVRLIFVLS